MGTSLEVFKMDEIRAVRWVHQNITGVGGREVDLICHWFAENAAEAIRNYSDKEMWQAVKCNELSYESALASFVSYTEEFEEDLILEMQQLADRFSGRS